MVDVISSNCWLKPAILAMQLSQMVVQAQWLTDSPLKQLPHFSQELIDQLKKKGVEDISDLMNMEEEDRKEVLRNISESEMKEIIRACNRYPSISIEKNVRNEGEIIVGENVIVDVVVIREGEETEFKEFVYAPYFPKVIYY